MPVLLLRAAAAAAIGNSRAIVVGDLDEAVEVSNRYAPEHLILQCEDARELLPAISNAGSVFVGPWTPESVGDYCKALASYRLRMFRASEGFPDAAIQEIARSN